MGIDLGHIGQLLIDVVSEDDILQTEIDSWAHRQVRDNHAIGLAAVLVEDYHVSQVLVATQVHQVIQHIPTPVDSLRVGHHNSHLLQKLQQPTRWIS